MTIKAAVYISSEKIISPIDDRLYSSFIEHMGRAVYHGIFEPGHPTADIHGFRIDVAEQIRKLNLTQIRYPGGNFLSGYNWEDGVGDPASRPIRRDLAWFAIEPNQVGTNEFTAYCKEIGVQPMMGVNLGTRGPQDAVNLLEYCNVEGGTYFSDLRRSHGYESPYGIKLWCLGNEMDGPWQICAKTAGEYGRIACETAKMMKWMDPSIELVACGSSYRSMPTYGTWERTVLGHCYPYVDYLSLHQYYQNNDGDVPTFLARNNEMDSFIKEVADICREVKKEKGVDHDVFLSFDEWNVWYHFQKAGKEPEKWTTGRPIEEEIYDFADALLLGSILTTLINNADTVKIACLAQLVNTIAPIMTENDGRVWLQTTYYPFLYTSQYGRGTALTSQVDAPVYDCAAGSAIPYLDCAAVLSDDRAALTLFLVNKHLTETMETTVLLSGIVSSRITQCVTLSGFPLDAVNTADNAPVIPVISQTDCQLTKDGINISLPAASWQMVRIAVG